MRFISAIVIALLALASPGAHVSPSVQAGRPAVVPGPWAAPKPDTDPLDPLRTLCAAAVTGQWLAPGALVQAMTAVVGPNAPADVQAIIGTLHQRPYCWGMALANPGEPPLILVGEWERPGPKSTVLWMQGNQWRATATDAFGGQPELLRQVRGAAGRDVFIADHIPGTAGAGRLVVLRETEDGWRTAFQSDLFERFWPKVLDADHLVVTARHGWAEFPLEWSANCCIPSTHQWLFERKAEGFAPAAERQAPDPYLSLNVFFGALHEAQPERLAWAGQWLRKVATPKAIAEARDLKLDAPQARAELPSESQKLLDDITHIELAHWRALPHILSGPVPTQTTLVVPVRLSGSAIPKAKVTLTRQADWWVVDSVKPAQGIPVRGYLPSPLPSPNISPMALPSPNTLTYSPPRSQHAHLRSAQAPTCSPAILASPNISPTALPSPNMLTYGPPKPQHGHLR